MKRGPYKRRPGESNASQRNNKKLSSGQTVKIEPNVISQATNTQTTCSSMPVLPGFVTPDASPNNSKDVFAHALTTSTTSLSQNNIPYTFDHHDLLMMPFSFADNTTTLQQDHFPLATTTITSHEYDLDKQQHLINDVPNYSTPTASPAAASATQFRFISQNSDFAL